MKGKKFKISNIVESFEDDSEIVMVTSAKSLYSIKKFVDRLEILKKIEDKTNLDIPSGSIFEIFLKEEFICYEYRWLGKSLSYLTLSELIGTKTFDLLSDKFKLILLYDIALGLKSLEKAKLVHCNLCPDTIIIREDGKVIKNFFAAQTLLLHVYYVRVESSSSN